MDEMRNVEFMMNFIIGLAYTLIQLCTRSGSNMPVGMWNIDAKGSSDIVSDASEMAVGLAD